MNKRNFVLVLTRLAETFGTVLTPARIDAYYETLSGKMGDAVFVEACRICREEEQFFPVPATIIRHARTLCSDDQAAEQAWTAVLRAARSYSPVRQTQPDFDDKATYALRAVGGIKWIAEQDEKQLTWIRKEFVAEYAVAEGREVDRRIAADDLPTLPAGNVRQIAEVAS